jgi:hypothetical protein
MQITACTSFSIATSRPKAATEIDFFCGSIPDLGVCNRDVPLYRDEPKLSAGASELAGNQLHLFVACLVIGTRSKRLLICHDGTIGFVNPQKLPPDWFFVVSATANLPGSHDRVVFLGETDGMNFDQSRIAIVLEFKHVP